MKKIVYVGNFQASLLEFIQLLEGLNEDFGIIGIVKKYPQLVKEHPECKNQLLPGFNDLLSKAWIENQILIKTGYDKMSYQEKAQASEKVKKFIISNTTTFGQEYIKLVNLEEQSFRTISFFVKKDSSNDYLNTLKLTDREQTRDMDLDFLDPIQNEARKEVENLKPFDL